MRTTSRILAAVLATLAGVAVAQNDSSPGRGEPTAWVHWQGRLTLGTSATPWRMSTESPSPKLSSAALMGDYYFAAVPIGIGRLGGFRATSGLIFGPRGSLSLTAQPGPAGGSALNAGDRIYGLASSPSAGDPGADPTATLPYLGFGYSGLSVRNGWSFSADLGLVAQGAGSAARLGRALGGGQSLDDAIRDMRLAPLVQLGASYSF